MKRFRLLGAGLLLLLGCTLLAEGPDDLFVRVYNLIQQADALQANGRVQEAQTKYLEARTGLEQLQTSYPTWNEKIVKYRKTYVAEKLGPNAPAPAPPKAPVPAVEKPAAAGAEENLSRLNSEIAQLRTERDALQAKLREALTAQPAAVDPRELAQAERRLEELRGQNERLRANAARQQEQLARAVDPAAFTESQKALKEAKDALKRQTQTVATLTKEREALQQQLKKANDKAQLRAQREQEKAPKQAPVVAPSQPKDLQPALDELRGKLNRTQEELAAERTRSEVLLAEKVALQKRVSELSTAPAPVSASTTNGVAAAAPAVREKAAPAAEAKTSKAMERAQIKQLERERDELRKRVAALTSELADRRLKGGGTSQDRLAEELSILRARIQVYEARQVPYTPEELALFKPTANLTGRSEGSLTKKSARQVPAGAAALVAEAQRAFQGRRLDEAERKFQQALVLDEKNVGLLADLAATHLEQNRLDAADATLKRALAEDPNDPDVLSLLGLLQFRQAKYEEALVTLSRAVRLNPDNALTQNYLGVTLSQKGQRVPSETAFRKAIQLDPNYAEAHYNLAVVYAHQKPPFFELARWHYQKALAAGQSRNPEMEKLLAGGAGAVTPK